jgi:hypothetical protein
MRGNADGALRLATLSARLDLKAKRAAAATSPALAALAARRDEIPEGSRTIVERLVKKTAARCRSAQRLRARWIAPRASGTHKAARS